MINETSEPGGGDMKVVLFERDCGATTGFSTHVSVMRADVSVSEKATWFRATESGNAFVADTNRGQVSTGAAGGPAVQVALLGPKQLQVTYEEGARVFLSTREVSGVTIHYVEGPRNTPVQPPSRAVVGVR